jgi:hypothetical protein
MDADLNWLIDNDAIRIILNTLAFAAWLATITVLLELMGAGPLF